MNCHYRSGNRNKHYILHNVLGVNNPSPGLNRLSFADEPEVAGALIAALAVAAALVGHINRHMASVHDETRYPCQCGKIFSCKDVDPAIKGLVLSDQNLNPCNLTPAWSVSQHPRQVPYPPYPGQKPTRRVEWARVRPTTHVFVYQAACKLWDPL